MNWFDEAALYSQVSAFLREDLGRGDITTQAVIARNTRARGRFVANEPMIVAGLEAAEEVFLNLDSQQQLEAFVADGEEITAGKVIARMSGFADVLLAGERVALNLLRRLSAVATLTSRFVKAVEGTNIAILDSRDTTPGLRMLEKYAVQLGGGRANGFGLDDGVLITEQHLQFTGGIANAIAAAQKELGHVHRVQIQVGNENELREAINAGAQGLILKAMPIAELKGAVELARELAPHVALQFDGNVSLENVNEIAASGVDAIVVSQITTPPNLLHISFQIHPF